MNDSRTDEEREEEAKIEVGFTATEETTEDDFKLNIIHKEEDEDCESCSAWQIEKNGIYLLQSKSKTYQH